MDAIEKRKHKSLDNNIDFVIYWVDGTDPEWIKKKATYKGTTYQNNPARFRDWGILKYWFRAVEEYAPWVNRIFFITDNQRPNWINFSNSKIIPIDHKEYIPEKFLPTFNSHTIELNIHRINGLSEHFVVFNDDTYINQPITPEYYFQKGIPCDGTYEHIFSGRGYNKTDKWGINIIDYVNTQIINVHFERSDVVRNNKKKWYGNYLGNKYRLQAYLLKLFKRDEFQHLYTPHSEKAFLKSMFEEAWEHEPELLSQSCTKFRENVSLNIYFIRYWQLASNNFYPQNVLKSRKVIQLRKDCINQIKEELFNPNIKSLCLNDSFECTYEDYQTLKPQIIDLFEKKFPNKSSFEL